MNIFKFSYFLFWSIYKKLKKDVDNGELHRLADYLFTIFWIIPIVIYTIPYHFFFMAYLEVGDSSSKLYFGCFIIIVSLLISKYIRKPEKLIATALIIGGKRKKSLIVLLFSTYVLVVISGIFLWLFMVN